jgi:hypothetical protein
MPDALQPAATVEVDHVVVDVRDCNRLYVTWYHHWWQGSVDANGIPVTSIVQLTPAGHVRGNPEYYVTIDSEDVPDDARTRIEDAAIEMFEKVALMQRRAS